MRKSGLLYLFFLPVLLLGLPQGIWASESGEAVNERNSGNALNRLIEISEQLSILNEKLRNELWDSRQSSRELQSMLEASKKELETLRQELEILHSVSAELLIAAENSQTELTALQKALRQAESSLTSLELSFGAYRQSAETRIRSLEGSNKLWKWGCVAAGVLAAGFGTAFFMGR